MAKNIESVAVLGGGFMGAGIAESASVAGLPVVIRELPEYLAAARIRLEKSMDSAVKRGKLDADKRDAALARVAFSSELKDVAGSDLVIEAVPENLALKVSIMKELNEIVSDDTILASNTSSIPIAELAGTVSRPDRVVGLHFFSPVPVMKLVEVVRALDTSDETIAAAKEFVTRLGKQPIETKDRSGFIVNFLLTSYLMGAVRMYEEGFASREDIDDGMKLGAVIRWARCSCATSSASTCYRRCATSLYDEFKRDEYAPPPLMKRMIAAGRLGRKSGRGFYEYTQ